MDYNFDDNIFKDEIVSKIKSLGLSQMDYEELFNLIMEACDDAWIDGHGEGVVAGEWGGIN